jgi:hypothetical protein
MKRNFLIVVFIAGAILSSTGVAQNKAAVPQQFNIALFYLNMPKHDPLYPLFLSKAYQLFKK